MNIKGLFETCIIFIKILKVLWENQLEFLKKYLNLCHVDLSAWQKLKYFLKKFWLIFKQNSSTLELWEIIDKVREIQKKLKEK